MPARTGVKRDYYDVLGVERTAAPGEIKRAYRKLAMQFHPDRVPADRKKDSEEKFKDVSEAYEVLADEEKRALYDRVGHAGVEQQVWGGQGFDWSRFTHADDLEDIFGADMFRDFFGGSIFGLFSGVYYWFPKLTGRMLSERLGKLHFWLMFIGMNLTFGPMHWLGLQGMIRRTWKYAPETGLEPWNRAVSVGAFMIATSIAIFMYNWWTSKRRGQPAGLDPWDARTLEWSIPSPVPEYNFAKVPVVHSLDDFWHRKYDEDENGRAVRKPDADELIARLEHEGNNPSSPIHLPNPSYFPIIMASGIPTTFYGIIYHTTAWGKALIAVGAVVVLSALIGWGMEPLEEPHDAPHDTPHDTAAAH